MNTKRNLGRRIEDCFPDFKVSNAKLILTGWDNFVLEVNGQYIFRFPRFRVSETHLRKEIAFLPFLKEKLPLAVPDYEFVWRGGQGQPGWFGGYRKIPGVPLTVGRFRLAWAERLAESVSDFLTRLHTLNTTRTPKVVPTYTPVMNFANLKRTRDGVRKLVYPHLSPSTRRRAEAFWGSLLADIAAARFRPALIHGDLTSRNVLLDPATGEAKGILDWGDASVSDPAYDFAGIFEVNKRLGERVLELYGWADRQFRRRVDWYVRMIPFYEILWGVEQGSEAFRENGKRRLEHRLRTQYVRAD